MSKRLRTSFNQFVREKVIQGINNDRPVPENMPLDQLVPEIHSYLGYVEYQEENHNTTGPSSGNYYVQGPMGYGPPPAGPGTEPFKCFLSNKVLNNSASSYGVMTGQPDLTPSVKLNNIHYSGVGCTFSVGLATQYRYTSDPSVKVDKGIDVDREHELVTIHGLNSTTTPLEHPDNALHFIYKITGDKTFQLLIKRGAGEVIGTPQSYTHPVNAYGRMLPVHFELKSDGSGEFRVDNAKIIFDITSSAFTGGSGTGAWSFQMPVQDTLSITINGLRPYNTGSSFGMSAAISRLTNVAVNDNNPLPCSNDVGIPPFIHGVSCTPIRKSINPGDAGWEMPSSVHDGMNMWTPFSETDPSVSYGLSAIMDNQTFDTRGVATSALSASLDIFLDKQSFTSRIDGASVTDDIEAINVMAYNAATFDGSDFAIQISGHTDWEVFPGLYDDPTIDSHLSFYHKQGSDCPQFSVNDFNTDLVFKIRAQ